MNPKTGKKAYHHGDLRNTLLAAAETVLRQRGVTDLSLREVAKVAGVSHTAPYRHFKDKNALLQALAAIGYQRLAEALRRVKAEFAAQPAEALVTGGKAYVELAVKNPEMTHLMFGGVLEIEEISEEDLVQCSGDAFGALLEIVDLGLEKGVYQARDRMDIALAAWSIVHGLAMLVTGGQLSAYATSDEAVMGLAQTVGEILQTGLLRKS